MKRTDTSAPFLSWCIIARNCADTMEATLKSLRERTPQAEIVIVDTMSNDFPSDEEVAAGGWVAGEPKTATLAKRYADVWEEYRGPRGDWDRDMFAFDDASAARNRSFEIAHGRWRAWADTDDTIPDAATRERILRANNMWETTPGGEVKVIGVGEVTTIEEDLQRLEELYPTADWVWCPYAYAHEGDVIKFTQERERFVRWNPERWQWREAAHEVLVPVSGPYPSVRPIFQHLLFVHEKKFTDGAISYSTRRHYDILIKQYDADPSSRTTRRCLYLATFAQLLIPEREWEFLEAAHLAATTPLDRDRSLRSKAAYHAARGFQWDAIECYAGSVNQRPDLPDAWLYCGEMLFKAEQYQRCVEWLEQGLARKAGGPETYINPRDMAIKYPTMLVEALDKVATAQLQVGAFDDATKTLEKATQWAIKIAKSPAASVDQREALTRAARLENRLWGHRHVLNLRDLVDYLLRNDESQKALGLLKSVPWNMKDHPAVIVLEQRLEVVRRHLQDSEAYREFYEDVAATGAMATPEQWIDTNPTTGTPLSRAVWIAEWVQRNCPKARILEVGCFDGILGIPILKLCPEATYVGVDMQGAALERFKERAQREGIADRVQLVHGGTLDAPDGEGYDVIVWCEIIEHVQDPVGDLAELALTPGRNGRVPTIFVTTPWGAFDCGHPGEHNCHGGERGNIGHVRVYTLRDMLDTVAEVRNEVNVSIHEAHRVELGQGIREEMQVQIGTDPVDPRLDAVSVAVPSALWEWNGTSVMRNGMGASEETIVYLARELAKDRRVSVYGPVPEAEVNAHVGYWPIQHLRHERQHGDLRGSLIVSRSPSFIRQAEAFAGKWPRKYLWLQDAYYPDINAETAALYDKVIVVSEWHRQLMAEQYGVPGDKMVVMRNFLLAEHFDGPKPQRKPDHFIYASSPDRGLLPLLRLWPRILKELPNATLDIFYGWRGCEKLGTGDPGWTDRYLKKRREYEAIKRQKGVRECGMIPHHILAKAYQQAGIWYYAGHDFAETCCLSICKARAAGCVPIVAPLAALNENGACEFASFPTTEDEAIAAVLDAVKVTDDARERVSAEAIEKYRIEAVLPAWKELLG